MGCVRSSEEWYSQCGSLTKTDLWATVIAREGRGMKWVLLNVTPAHPHVPRDSPQPPARCYLLLSIYKHILPWTCIRLPTQSHTHIKMDQQQLEASEWQRCLVKQQQWHRSFSTLTAYLKVKGLLEESQPTSLNIADHCLTIRWLRKKVPPSKQKEVREHEAHIW